VLVAWLSLEEIDDEPVALWAGIMAAVEQLAPGTTGVARELMVRGAADADVVHGLLDELERASTGDAVLVLDDVHHVTDPSPGQSLATFLQHLPTWLHVVVVGRTDPPLPLDRLRVRDQLTEVRYAELRFTPTRHVICSPAWPRSCRPTSSTRRPSPRTAGPPASSWRPCRHDPPAPG
jgi:ATP/maltotriose-dependent transcriptional regulator MalT